MGFFEALSRRIVKAAGVPIANRQTRPLRARGFNSANPDRLTSHWQTWNESSNRELRYALRNLRGRSRSLCNNNEYATRFLDLCTQNIVGPDGVQMEPQGKNSSGELDKANNDQIEEAWDRWTKRGICTVDGQLSWVDAQNVLTECAARDGEVLIKHIIGKEARNEFGYAMQIIEADYLDDMYYEANDSSGAGIFMGVKTDASGRVLGYYLLDYNPGDYGYSGSAGRKFVPVGDLAHVYVPRRGHQRRGVPWMFASMGALYQLGEFKEAELVATRISAAKMGFYKQNTEGSAPMGSDDQDEQGEPIQEVEPGIFERLPYGWDVHTVDWHHPNVAFEQFVKSCLRGSAAGTGVGYNQLAGDLENVNYSSLREGRLDTVDMWRKRQRWFRDWVCQPVFSKWLDMSILTGQISIPQRKAEAYRYPKWQARGWGWVDPQKEAESNRIALALGLRTRTEILSEQGKDFTDVIEQLAAEAKQMIALGLNPDVPMPGKSSSPGVEDAPNSDTTANGAPKNGAKGK